MKKYHIGFNANFDDDYCEKTDVTMQVTLAEPKKSVVQVYFPSRGLNLAYYNDSFDLKVGDLVYVDGKLEGLRGQVTGVNYSFKIKLSDYKRVVAVVDTDVKGDLYFAGSHLVTFSENTIPFEKVKTWFKAPEAEEEYVSSNDDTNKFPLDNLTEMDISTDAADMGRDYYMENRVSYICIDGTHGYAVVEGRGVHEIEFRYDDGEISNLICSCFCGYACKHEFAVMLQLRETLEFITKNYENEYKDYFAAVSKSSFMNIIMNKKESGKISFGV